MKNQNESVENNRKVAVVTGSSSGIGYATALQLARNGYLTFATMRNTAKGADLIKAAESEKLPLDVEQLDVTRPESISKAVTRISNFVGRIDVLVNNAGYATVGALEDLSMKEIQDQLDTNLLGAIRATQQVLPVMRKQRSGVIVNVSSVVGRIALPYFSAYVATKFAMEGLTESLSYEVAPFGIRVILIEPGAVKTKVWDNHVRAQGALRKDSPYSDMLRGLDSNVNVMFEHGSNADQIAAAILQAISSPEPKLRYPVGHDATNWLAEKKTMTDEQFLEYMKNQLAGSAAPRQR
jgi:NAD(P)-dependent dehydrogenase (short-subunit alcohol dehydrogenase family)